MQETYRSVPDVTERNVPELPSASKSESGCSVSDTGRSDAFAAGMFAALIVPSAMWQYDGRVTLAAAAVVFAAVYAVVRIGGMLRNRKKHAPRVEYVTRRPFEEDRRLGYVSAEAICRAAKGDRKE